MEERRIISINYSRKFLKKIARLPKRIIEQAKEKETIFKNA